MGTNTLPVGTIVLFGRPGGEQTRGKIVKVNPSKYKVEQLESRGTMKAHRVGTVWTVPFNFVTAVPGGSTAPTPVPFVPTIPAPADDLREKALWESYSSRIGLPADAFGKTFRSKGTEYRVTGLALNRPKFPVDCVRTRDGGQFKFTAAAVRVGLGLAAPTTPARPAPAPTGNAVGRTFTFRGTEYRVTGIAMNRPRYPVSAERVRDGKRFKFPMDVLGSTTPTTPTTSTSTFKVGQPVTYKGFSWTARGSTTVTGVVTLVRDDEIEVFSSETARHTDRIAPSTATPAAKRDAKAIMDDIRCAYGCLSPENLTCDGERPRREVAQAAAELNRALRALFSEIGRRVDESEVYDRD